MYSYRSFVFISIALLGCSGPDSTGLFGGSNSSGTNGNGGGGASSVSSAMSSGSGGTTSTSSSVTATGSGGQCNPINCLDVGKNCGCIDNGCGNTIYCGEQVQPNCNDDICPGDYQGCGEAAPTMMGVDNVCGGGCTDDGFNSGPGTCPDDPNFYIDVFECNGLGTTSPMANCDPLDGAVPTHVWCCKVKAKP